MSGPQPLELTDQQRLVRDSIRAICADFDKEYWREKDRSGEYPLEFVDTLSEQGWFGILIPEAYGGVGMTTEESVVMMEEIAAGGGGFSAAQAIHGGIYNSVPLVNYGSVELKEAVLPAVAAGNKSIQAFGLTEPNAGSDSTSIETEARKEENEYIINGQKIWTSRVDQSDYLVLMARTTPKSAIEKRTDGMSMFLVDLEDEASQDAIEMKAIPKTASNFVHSFELWFEELPVPEHHLIGQEGEGFYQMLDGLNEERLVIAAECLGLGQLAVEAAVAYANEREVFGQAIGANQAIQHPIASAHAQIQAAKHLVYNAARMASNGTDQNIGSQANTGKYLAARAAYAAADAAVQTHGGFGVAREYDVERYFREARLTRLVPITQELALNYLGEKVLGLPRSY